MPLEIDSDEPSAPDTMKSVAPEAEDTHAKCVAVFVPPVHCGHWTSAAFENVDPPSVHADDLVCATRA